METETAGVLVLLGNTQQSLSITLRKESYIHQGDDHRGGRMKSKRLEGIDHVVHILLAQQSTQNTSLQVDHVFGLGYTRIEVLGITARVLVNAYFNVRKKLI